MPILFPAGVAVLGKTRPFIQDTDDEDDHEDTFEDDDDDSLFFSDNEKEDSFTTTKDKTVLFGLNKTAQLGVRNVVM